MGAQAPSGPRAPAGPDRADEPEVTGGPAPSDEPVARARGVLELVALVLAPTTIVTALAYYFGWVLTNSRASYFGVDASALGFTTQDYLLRSADALFVPLGTVLVLALALLWLHTLAVRQLGDRRWRDRLRIAAIVEAAAGVVLFVLGVIGVFWPLSFSPHYLFASAAPGIGIILLVHGLYLLGRIDGVERPKVRPAADARLRAGAIGLVLLIVVLSGFWTASKYADALGRGRGERLAATLTSRPQVTVYTPQRLELEGDGVVERQLRGDDLAYRYRYSGLRLLIRSGGKYFLLPEGWTRGSGAAFVLADSPDYRFEFGVGP
jgi:hypothetical protein